MRRLLELDRPLPVRTDEELQGEVWRNYRWNFAFNLLDGVWFWFGISFLSSTTIVPLFITKLTPNPLFIGLAAMIAQGAWFLPQLFTANVIERLPRKKAVVVNLGLFLERLPMWIIVLAAPLALVSPALALAVFFLGYGWHGLGAGVVAPSWQELIARCFPVAVRGRFMGVTLFLGAAVGIFSAFMATRLLNTYPFPVNFTYIFIFAAVGVTLSWVFLAGAREPLRAAKAPRRSNREFFAALPGLVQQDANFRRYLLARLLLVLGSMGTAFVTVAAVQRFNIPDGKVGIYTAEILLGQTTANLTFGLLADRYGHKLSLELGALASMIAFLVAWLAPSARWYDLVFFGMGITSGAIVVSGILIVLEFAPHDRRPTYAGMANTAVGAVSLVGPLAGAWLAGISYSLLFAISALFYFSAWVAMRWGVAEPRWDPPASSGSEQPVV